MTDKRMTDEKLNREMPYRLVLRFRGIRPDDVCGECKGFGVKTYGNTSTWRHGIGGSMLTNDVCDKCWGSGNRHRPWPSRRRMEALENRVRQLEVGLSRYLSEIDPEDRTTEDGLLEAMLEEHKDYDEG